MHNEGSRIFNNSGKPLRIVQVAPDVYPVPPVNYGGIERVVYDLTEELVKLGHEVYLFAPKGSRTSAELIAYKHLSAWNQNEIIKDVNDLLPDNIDIIHDHTHSSVIGRLQLKVPVVCTEHFSFCCPVRYPVYASKTVLDSCGGGIGFYVHHGINIDQFEFSDSKENYLLYIGKLDQSKGPQVALEVSEKTNKMLIIAGPIHDKDYFNQSISPRIAANPNICYVGKIGGRRKIDLIKNAYCVLFPTLCQESFGLVAVESMACGTPVLAFPGGAVPEVLSEFPELICKNAVEMSLKVAEGKFPTPYSLRQFTLNNYTSDKMAEKYIEVYRKVIKEHGTINI